jgi:hypothetical protein
MNPTLMYKVRNDLNQLKDEFAKRHTDEQETRLTERLHYVSDLIYRMMLLELDDLVESANILQNLRNMQQEALELKVQTEVESDQ